MAREFPSLTTCAHDAVSIRKIVILSPIWARFVSSADCQTRAHTGNNLARLWQVKHQVDPTNAFVFNQSIRGSG
eukprot:m.1503980 g.1503980  ORF g.1503980 m.1503980 type:complete len:74 (-) comp25208_c0_seq22:4015-4236(-)